MYHFWLPRAEDAQCYFDMLESNAVVTSDTIPGGCVLMAQDLSTGAEIWGAGIAAEQRRRVLLEIATTAGTLDPPLDAVPVETAPPTREWPRWR